MKRISVVTAMVLAASILTSGAAFAAPVSAHSLVFVTSGKPKMVSFNVQNSTASVIKVKAGDKEMTLQPGTTTAVKLPVGTQLVTEVAVPHYEEGSVLATVSKELGDSTVILQ